jgi:hypothetical protein
MASIPLSRATWTAWPVASSGTFTLTNPSATAPIYVGVFSGSQMLRWSKAQKSGQTTMALTAGESVKIWAGAACTATGVIS